MSEMLVSIIVPAYNAEKILPKCLDSILAQTYQSYEVILINDGSKDRTGEVADGYAAKDNRVKVIHKANGGVSSARNEGLKIAAGEWVVFIDSDDWVEPRFIESFFTGGYADLMVGGYNTVGCHEVREASYEAEYAATAGELAELFKSHITDMTFLCPWAKMFRNSILKESSMMFDTNMKIGEDTAFVWEYLDKCSSISLRSGQFYNYYTESSDFKYAIDEDVALYTIQRLVTPLNVLSKKYEWDISEAKDYIITYYTWLYKLYVKSRYTIKDIPRLSRFFYHDWIKDYFTRNRNKTTDRMLVYSLMKLHLMPVLFAVIKLYY